MDRRDFLKKASAAGIGLALPQTADEAEARDVKPPNILFIMIDQMRFPSVYPQGVHNTAQFLARFMPHTYSLWKSGVKFVNHFGASSACTPSRGVIVTGLYSQQQWITQTLTNAPGTKFSVVPVLDPGFPTYGKLLRAAGYATPYIGKWHLSLEQARNPLEVYGFDGMTSPDPTGSNLQGAVGDEANGFLNDKEIATQAVRWLGDRKTSDKPWCLTVSFINPHDHEFFWGGTEFQTFNNLFDGQNTYLPYTYYSSNNGTDYPPVVSWDDDILKNPHSYGYPALPRNWETPQHLQNTKPSTHTFLRYFQGFVWGGISDDSTQTAFTIAQYPSSDPSLAGYGIGNAPYSYWQRNLDSYTQTMSVVDVQIGRVLNALPADVKNNTVVVFVSDHGDYVGAHGLVSNKAATAYDEAFHVPLIVVDHTGRFAGDVGANRTGLTSSVDLLNLLVSLGHNGSQQWMTGAYRQMYGKRHNMIPMLRSSGAPGRRYVLFATDELVQPLYNFNDSPLHIVCMRTATEKFAFYSKWRTYSANVVPSSIELEFYDYTTPGGRLETANTPNDARVPALLNSLRNRFIPDELRAPLPGAYRFVQRRAQQAFLQYSYLVENPPNGDDRPQIVKKWLGLGQDY
ncbi:MAG TPA: sulfatase-like hydrolase/transferase [Vicinamibacterales bacterium]|nr:sulfatase-like hydrolase/transferase [Vicinamibacterales bacterium]